MSLRCIQKNAAIKASTTSHNKFWFAVVLLLFAGAMQWCWMFEITAIFHSIKIVKLLLLFMYGSFIFITFFDIDVSCNVNKIRKHIVKKGLMIYCISDRWTFKSVTNRDTFESGTILHGAHLFCNCLCTPKHVPILWHHEN